MVSMMVRKVRKVNGSIEDFDPEKIITSIMKAGGSRELGEKIVKEVKELFRDKDIITTIEIRRVIFRILEQEAPDVKDSYFFYDRLVKGRITFEAGKFIVVREGSLYLGRNVIDIGEKGLSHLEEVRGLIDEFEEDMEVGGFRAEIADRRSKILIQAIKDSSMSDEEKAKAIELVNEFRRKHGLSPAD